MSAAQNIITIDGPAGSGKSTAARRLAEALGFTHVNTGAMYRAVAHLALTQKIKIDDPAQAAAVTSVARTMRFTYRLQNGQQRFIVNGQDCTEALFTVELTGQLKPVVNNNDVRAALVAKMRESALGLLAQGARGVIMEGRDIGTVVFPDAPVKFFIHADLEARTQRRAAELTGRGETFDVAALKRQIQYRDDTDKGREVGALIRAADAIDVDTTDMDEAATLQYLLGEVRKRLGTGEA